MPVNMEDVTIVLSIPSPIWAFVGDGMNTTMVASDHSSPGSDAGGTTEIRTPSRAITAICQPTDHKESCVNSLTSVAGDPIASKALENCKELMDYSLDDLNCSLNKLGEFDLSKLDDILDDIKIWLSGSLTYQETCLDSFDGSKSDAGLKMKEAIHGGTELTSNVIAIVDEVSSILTSLDLPFLNHRLLSTDGDATEDEIPSWVSSGRRGLLSSPLDSLTPDVVIAKDGSGDYTAVSAAVAAASKQLFRIYIKSDVYRERVKVGRNKTNIVFIGDGIGKAVIMFNRHANHATSTLNSATVVVKGFGFVAENMTFENSAGPNRGEAVTLVSESGHSAFYKCSFLDYQATLYARWHGQFYWDCDILWYHLLHFWKCGCSVPELQDICLKLA